MSIFARKSPALDEEKTSLVAMEGNAFITRAMAESAAELENRRRFQEYAAAYVAPYPSVEFDAYGNIRPIPDPHTNQVKNLSVPEKFPVAVAHDSPDAQYLALAAKLGIRSTALLAAELECLLASEMIPVYDYRKVAEYLQNECEKASRSQPRTPWTTTLMWCWKPVREQDRLENKSYAPISSNLYQQALRLPVLLLAVTVEGAGKLYVIERWDEPGFRS